MAAVLALLASLTWGAADFLGGSVTRRLPPTAVVAVSQSFALLGLSVVALVLHSWGSDPGYVGWAVAAAAFGVVALIAFYSALATGRMGVVAPVAALGVVVPVVVGLADGDRPTVWQAIGVVVAIVGVVLASGPELRTGGTGRRPLLLAVVAAVGFGAVIVCVSRGARTNTVMTLVTMRAVSVFALLLLRILVGRVRLGVPRRELPVLAAIGAGDVGANAMFAYASTRGLLSIVAVLSSLYPAVTVLLARAVHGERMLRVQEVGVVAVMAGVVLVASGGSV